MDGMGGDGEVVEALCVCESLLVMPIGRLYQICRVVEEDLRRSLGGVVCINMAMAFGIGCISRGNGTLLHYTKDVHIYIRLETLLHNISWKAVIKLMSTPISFLDH